MASPGYLTLYDTNGKPIEGHCQVDGRVGTIEVYAFEHSVEIPVDRHDGTLTGTRQHGDFVIVKGFCPASPILYKACAAGKTLSRAELNWYRINPQGAEEAYFRQTLENVRIVRIRPYVKDVKVEAHQSIGHREELALRYEKINWTYLDGNIMSEDAWSVRGAA